MTAATGVLMLSAAIVLSALASGQPSPMDDKVKPVIPIKAQSFSAFEVRLLEGPFKAAQDADHRYLLSLDPERLLHNFRVNAGLPSAAQPLGGWEAPNVELRGHFVGHYLSACARMFAATGDEKLKQKAEYVTAQLALCQEKLGDGYLSAFPEEFLDRVESRRPVWAPWYTLHKILAGLLDTYCTLNCREALNAAEKFADWAKRRTDKLSEPQMQAMLGTEHGGMNEALANLYAVTGKQDYLNLARRFNHRVVLDPLARREDPLTGLHANTQIPKVIGAAREYELTGDPAMQTAARYFWEVVTQERSYVIGGNSDGEMFSPKEHLSRFLSAHTTETCNTYNMLKLTRHLMTWDPKPEYVEYYERALYNHILASQNPTTGMTCYYVPLQSGSRKAFSTPNGSFWCCTGTGVENHASYADSIYFSDEAGILVNLFIASELNWKEKGIRLRQETRFPLEDATRFAFTCERPTALSLRIRRPGWAGAGYRILVNGKLVSGAGAPGSYVSVARTWITGDKVTVKMPMSLRTEAFRDNPRRLAFLYGPLVLCGAIVPGGCAPSIIADITGVLPAVSRAKGDLLAFSGSPEWFRSVDPAERGGVQLIPFYQKVEGNYAVYWDVLTPAEWDAKAEEYRAEVARQKQIQSRTVDSVQPGDRRSERAHRVTGESTYTGDFGERTYRDARDGGWFSYELKVGPDLLQELSCTYWGGDRGRDFEVLIDGSNLASQSLNAAHPGRFFEEVYLLDPERLKGKSSITVRFQARARGMAGGVFDCRVLRRSP